MKKVFLVVAAITLLSLGMAAQADIIPPGFLDAWGENLDGQCNVPSGDDYMAVSVGGYHSVALKSDGSLAAWGADDIGQCNAPAGSNYLAVSAGGYHSVALKSGGFLAAWGYNDFGQCTVPLGSNYLAVSAGGYHSVALKSDGSLAAWGDNSLGQRTVPAGKNYVAISAGGYHNVALKSDGSLAAWGYNAYGQCTVPLGSNYVAVAAGGYHSLALKSDGSLVAWGYNGYGQCIVPKDKNYVAVSAGRYHNVALKSDASLAAWGSNGYGQCIVPAGNNYAAVSAGRYHSAAISLPPPTVTSIAPSSGESSDYVYISNLAGTGFMSNAEVKLTKPGEIDIAGEFVSVVSFPQITCRFDLAGKAAGVWHVVVTNPDGQFGTLTDGFTVLAGTTPPTVTINHEAGLSDPTSVSPINFSVVFSESVSGFATGDVILSGTAGATTATVTGSGTTYNVGVSGMISDGTVTAEIAAGVAHDADGHANAASTSTDNTITLHNPRTITANVTLKNWTSVSVVTLPFQVEYRKSGTSDVPTVETLILPVTPDGVGGAATISITHLSLGVYDVSVKCNHWLASKLTGIDVTAGDSIGNTLALTNADINNDNTVNFSDYLILQTQYKKTPGSPTADLNGDGAVNFSDYLILQTSYKKTGDVL